MRVLWLCNVIPPMIAERLGMQGSNKEGWLSGLLSRVIRDEERGIKLGLCFPCEKDGLRGEADGIAYYGFYEDTARPERYDTRLEGVCGRSCGSLRRISCTASARNIRIRSR